MADYKSKFTGEEIDDLLESLEISVVPTIFRKALDNGSLTFDIVKKCFDEGIINIGQFIKIGDYPSYICDMGNSDTDYHIVIRGMRLLSNGVIDTKTYYIDAYDNKVEKTTSYVSYQLQEASSGGGAPV